MAENSEHEETAVNSYKSLLQNIQAGKQFEYIFFWGHTPQKEGTIDKSCLSQWWPTTFSVDDITYQSAEQYMMAEKAALFGDHEIRQKILSTNDPSIAKKLGRQVNNFNSHTWESNREKVVFEGNIAKFTQSIPLQQYLLSTGNAVLVEASPEDCIWGIGVGADDVNASNPEQWKGLNLLGFILMDVRKKVNQRQ